MQTRPIPILTCDRGFTIERLTRNDECGSEFPFRVTIRLSDRTHHEFRVRDNVLFDFGEFRTAALFGANVYLRHEAETDTQENRQAWLDLIEQAIRRSAGKEQHPLAG